MMENIIEMLHNGQHSLVISNGSIRTFDKRGIADLYAVLKQDPEFLNGASLADKVIGKAAATLMVLGGVREVYADIICLSAIDLLRNNRIQLNYGIVVPNIINRTKTGLCPLEIRCQNYLTPQECFNQIEEFIELQNNK